MSRVVLRQASGIIRSGYVAGAALTIALFGPSTGSHARAAESDFLNGVRAYLADHCIRCHGEAGRKAGLRLDKLGDDFSSGETAGV